MQTGNHTPIIFSKPAPVFSYGLVCKFSQFLSRAPPVSHLLFASPCPLTTAPPSPHPPPHPSLPLSPPPPCTHRWGLRVVLLHLAHKLEVTLLLLQYRHLLFAVLQTRLCVGEFVTQPRVLLTQAAHLSSQLLLLRLHVLQVTRQRHHHLTDSITSPHNTAHHALRASTANSHIVISGFFTFTHLQHFLITLPRYRSLWCVVIE